MKLLLICFVLILCLMAGMESVPFVSVVTGTRTSTARASSTSTAQHPSPWYTDSSTGRIFLRFFGYVIVFAVVSTAFRLMCKSKKTAAPPAKQEQSVATIEGKREEAPPTYTQIYRI